MQNLTVSPKTIDFRVVHSLPGRLRIAVEDLKENGDEVGACLLSLGSQPGIISVRTNIWAGSATIEYDREVLSSEQLHEQLKTLRPGSAQPLPNASRPAKLVSSVLQWIEKQLPSIAQFAISTCAFLSAAFKLSPAICAPLMAVSVLPMITRASRTLMDERKVGVDGLDATAALMMLANGRLIEAGFMTALIALGELIRDLTARRCERIVKDLLGMKGKTAWLLKGKKRIQIPASEVRVGDIIVVYAGDMVPVDGTVVRGFAAVDQSKLTGEFIPVEVAVSDTVHASTTVTDGKIYIKCSATGSETKAALVLDLVAAAPIGDTRIQSYAAQVADRMVVPIFAGAAICFAVNRNFVQLMTMLIFDFSTGIRIAAPTAVLSSMHRAGKKGILIKNGAALEKLATVTAIVFDKTGTLTSGEPKITGVVCLKNMEQEEIVALAAAAEERINHPASRAIIRHALHLGVTIPHRGGAHPLRGMGVKAEVNGKMILVGNRRLMEQEGIAIGKYRQQEHEVSKTGASVAWVAVDAEAAGLIAYSDELRPKTMDAIKQLRKLNVRKIVMATGDGELAAKTIAQQCGIDEVMARAFPEHKADLVKQLKAEGHVVAVVGDGINDSPALAHADVAISLHGGTESAQETANVVLTDGDIRRLPESIEIARRSIRLVQQNLSLAVVPNTIGLGLAALGLIGPTAATLLNNGSAIVAAGYSLTPLLEPAWIPDEPVQ